MVEPPAQSEKYNLRWQRWTRESRQRAYPAWISAMRSSHQRSIRLRTRQKDCSMTPVIKSANCLNAVNYFFAEGGTSPFSRKYIAAMP